MTTPINGATSEQTGLISWWKSLWSKARSSGADARTNQRDDDFATLEDEGKVFGGGAARKSEAGGDRKDGTAAGGPTGGNTAGGDTASTDEALDAAQFTSALWELGRFDGSVGQKPGTAEAALTHKTDLDWAHQELAWKRKLALDRIRGERLESDEKRLAEEVEALRARRWELSSHPLLPPDRRYPLMALVYVGLGVLAFFAEIPLAAGLLTDSGVVNAQPLLLKWMAMSTPALVVTLCLLSLSFKIVLDGFDSQAPLPVGDAAPGKNAGNRDAELARARAKRDAQTRWVKGIRVAVFVLCVVTMGSLAMLRVETARVAALLGPAGAAASAGDLAAAEEMRDFWAHVALTALTVTLPLYGAMCLYAGATRIRQSIRDREAHQALGAATKELENKREDLARRKADIAALEARIEDEKDGAKSMKDALLQTRLNIYRHGYDRGTVRPEEYPPTSSHFEFHRDALKRLSQRRVRAYTAPSGLEPSGLAHGNGNGAPS